MSHLDMSHLDRFIGFFPFAFVGMWALISFLLAQIGWNQLRDFSTHSAPQGQSFHFESGTIGGPRYKGALTLVLTANGLYLRPLWLFGWFHRPLFIPYGAFGPYRAQKVMWQSATQFMVCNARGQRIPLSLENKALCAALIEKIEAQRALQGGSLRGSALPRAEARLR